MLLLPKPKRHILITILILTIFVFTVNFGLWLLEPYTAPVWAGDEVEEIEEELEEKIEEKEDLEGDLSDLEGKIAQLNEDVAALGNQLSVTQQDLNRVASQAKELGEEIAALEVRLSEMRAELATKEQFRNQFVRLLYKERQTPLWEIFFAGESLSRLSKSLVYQSFTISDLKEKIAGLNTEIGQVEQDKERLTESKTALEKDVVRIAALKDRLAAEKEEVGVKVAKVQKEREEMSFKLAEVSAEIRKLLQAKLAATSERMTVGTSERGAQDLPDPDFSPAFAVVSHGYPHRVGLNQYGAKGRAEEGQDYKKILGAYYDIDEDDIRNYSPVKKIHVKGCSVGRTSEGSCKNNGYKWYDEVIDFEKYLKSLGEMPSSWPEEALKAQAVAARTYALYYIDSNEEGIICPSPCCQAYLGYEKGGAWDDAVEDTEGEVIVKGDKPIAAYYCSTAGGFTRLTTDWEPVDVFSSDVPYDKRVIDNPFGELSGWDDSYGKDSPWMSWVHYKEEEEDPWLTEEELVDIINVALLYEKDSSLRDRLYQEDPVAFDDVEPGMSANDVRDKLGDQAIEEVDSDGIEVEWSSDGCTSKVKFNEDVEINGDTFAQVFNMRSPGFTVVYSSLYSIKVED